MKKLLTLTFAGLLSVVHAAQAGVPDLNDWVPVNQKAAEDQRPIQQAAAVILWANAGKSFRSLSKSYNIEFDEDERSKFEIIFKTSVQKAGSAYVMKALNEETLHLDREGVVYTLKDNKGQTAIFKIGTEEELSTHLEVLNSAHDDDALPEDAEELFQLAVRYVRGDGIAKDRSKGIELLTMAAKQDHSEAQYRLALCFLKGLIVEQDNDRAIELLRMTAKQGHMEAQYKLGTFYFNGHLVQEDQKQAVRCFFKAGKQGHLAARYRLALCCVKGDGTERNYEKAAKLFQLVIQSLEAENDLDASEKKQLAAAQYNLGHCYYKGLGVEEDHAEGMRLYKAAAEQEHPRAIQILAELEK